MTISSKALNVLLIDGDSESQWLARLRSVAVNWGHLQIVPVETWASQVTHYDVVIIDESQTLEHPQLIRSVAQRWPDCKIVIISETPEWRRARQAFQAGASDYLPSSSSAEEFNQLFSEL